MSDIGSTGNVPVKPAVVTTPTREAPIQKDVAIGTSDRARAAETTKEQGKVAGTRSLGEFSVTHEVQGQVEEGPIVNLFDEMLLHIISYLPLPAVLSARSVNKGLEKLITTNVLGEYHVNLSTDIINNPKVLEKVLEFASKNKLKICLKLPEYKNDDEFMKKSPEHLQQLSDFLSNCDQGILNQVDAIEIGHIVPENNSISQELADQLPAKCPNLVSFTCGVITPGTDFRAPGGFKNPIAVSCGHILWDAKFNLPKNPMHTVSFSCLQIASDIGLPENKEPSNFVSFNCGDIGTYNVPRHLTLPASITDFSCMKVNADSTVDFAEGSKLVNFSCGDMYPDSKVTLPQDTQNVVSLAFRNISPGAIISVPNKSFPALKSVVHQRVADNETLQVFEDLEKNIPVNKG